MTGQVDEAGRKDRWIAALYPHGSEYPPRVERAMAEADREVAELRTQLAEAEAREALREKPWHSREIWATMKRAEPAMRDELMAAWAVRDDLLEANAVLAGQVAAIRALCDSQQTSMMRAGWLSKDDVRAALVASSPTTPEAKK